MKTQSYFPSLLTMEIRFLNYLPPLDFALTLRRMVPSSPLDTLAAAISLSIWSSMAITSLWWRSNNSPTNLQNPWILYLTHLDTSKFPWKASDTATSNTVDSALHNITIDISVGFPPPSPIPTTQLNQLIGMAMGLVRAWTCYPNPARLINRFFLLHPNLPRRALWAPSSHVRFGPNLLPKLWPKFFFLNNWSL